MSLSLIATFGSGDQRGQAVAACGGQRMAGECAVVFCWVAVPYRVQWRYPLVWPKLVAIDAGHICENLYLAAEACGCGCCAIAAYSQSAMDTALGVDGEKQYSVYAAVVGKQLACDAQPASVTAAMTRRAQRSQRGRAAWPSPR